MDLSTKDEEAQDSHQNKYIWSSNMDICWFSSSTRINHPTILDFSINDKLTTTLSTLGPLCWIRSLPERNDDGVQFFHGQKGYVPGLYSPEQTINFITSSIHDCMSLSFWCRESNGLVFRLRKWWRTMELFREIS